MRPKTDAISCCPRQPGGRSSCACRMYASSSRKSAGDPICGFCRNWMHWSAAICARSTKVCVSTRGLSAGRKPKNGSHNSFVSSFLMLKRLSILKKPRLRSMYCTSRASLSSQKIDLQKDGSAAPARRLLRSLQRASIRANTCAVSITVNATLSIHWRYASGAIPQRRQMRGYHHPPMICPKIPPPWDLFAFGKNGFSVSANVRRLRVCR